MYKSGLLKIQHNKYIIYNITVWKYLGMSSDLEISFLMKKKDLKIGESGPINWALLNLEN